MPRLIKGGVDLQVFAVYQEQKYKPGGVLKRALKLIYYLRNEIRNNENITLVKEYKNIFEAKCNNQLGVLISLEGADALEGDIYLLDIFYELGVRILGLTWNNRNFLADGVGEEDTGGGLTKLGKKAIKMCNDKKIILDLAHLSNKGFKDVLSLTTKPVIVSHANCRRLCSNIRNLSDDQLKSIRDNNGVIGLTFCPNFIKDEEATLEDLLDHFVYIVDLIGIDYIGLGSDFDGIKSTLPSLGSVDFLPNLTESLFKKGFTKSEIKKILGENFLRVFNSTL